MRETKTKTFNAWLSDANCNPIEGTDKLYSGPSQRWVVRHIAYENKIVVPHGSLSVRLPDGNVWNVMEI